MKHIYFLIIGTLGFSLQAAKFKFINDSSKPAWVTMTTRTQKIFTIPTIAAKSSAEIDTGSYLIKTIQFDKNIALDYGEKPEGATYYIKDSIRINSLVSTYGGRYLYKQGDPSEQKTVTNGTTKTVYIDVGAFGPGLILEPNKTGGLVIYRTAETIPVYANSMLDMPLTHIPAGNFWCKTEWKNIDAKSIIKMGKKLSPTSMREIPDYECVFEKAP